LIDKHGLLTIAANPKTGHVLTSANSGQIFSLDPKMNHSVVKKFNDAEGAVTDLAFSADHLHFCSVSLDRHLRIYSLETSELVRDEFLFQRLEKCVFNDELFDFDAMDIEASGDEEQAEVEQESTPLFRDKLKKLGGKLTHNYIKLKYEKRHKVASNTEQNL
jgi:WD40 repeat protein